MKTIKKKLERIMYFYEMQNTSAKIFLITITAISLICFVATAVNIFYYGL